MTKLRKKMLISSVMMMLVSAICLSSVTFAWFSATTTASISTLNFKATASTGLRISSAGLGDYKGVLSLADFASNSYIGNKNIIPTLDANDATKTIQPVSSVGTTSAGYLDMFKAEDDGSGTGAYNVSALSTEGLAGSTTVNAATENGEFFAVDMFVSTANNYTLYLASSTVSDSDTSTNNRLSYSVRVAFVAYTAQTNANDALSNVVVNSVFIWEPNANVHCTNQVLAADRPTDHTGYSAEKTYAFRGAATAVDPGDSSKIYVTGTNDTGCMQELGTAPVANSGILFSTNSTGASWNASATKVASLTTGYTKIRIYIWIEGQDIDNTDYVAKKDISVALNFNVEPVV